MSRNVRPPKDGGRTFSFCVLAGRLITGLGPRRPDVPSCTPVSVFRNCWWIVVERWSTVLTLSAYPSPSSASRPLPFLHASVHSGGIRGPGFRSVSRSRHPAKALNEHPYGREVAPCARNGFGLWRRGLCRRAGGHPPELAMPAQIVTEIAGRHTLKSAQPESPIPDQTTNPVHRPRRPGAIHTPRGDYGRSYIWAGGGEPTPARLAQESVFSLPSERPE